ncbi:MAG: AraC family transcriptional regulator, partial [Eisenbergiella sp.]
ITGEAYMPYFTETVVYKSDIAQSVQDLYRAVLNDAPLLEKEENLFFLLDQILREYASDFESADVLRPNRQIQSLCQYMEEHFAENVTLDERFPQRIRKSYLPFLYQADRGVALPVSSDDPPDKAKRPEEGIAPIDAAGMAGFFDQVSFYPLFKGLSG